MIDLAGGAVLGTMDFLTIPTWIIIGLTIVLCLMIWIFLQVIPGAAKPRAEVRSYTQEEIESHDRYLPKYFLGAMVAVVIGGVQEAVKNYPPLYLWLYQAGYGGHMFRDLANTHIIIVGGGTLLMTALIWYTLPRICRRPLYSDNLAHLAFWFTLIGVFSFYIALSFLGFVEGDLVRHGWYWIAARDHIGIYQVLPLAMSSSIMGVGYWCFVGNIYLTLRAARKVPGYKPYGHLQKFYFVGATGLLIGTVQGVIQVQPDKVNWLHHVGPAGDFIDPISHAHVNMVTGVCSLIAGITFYLLPQIRYGSVSNKAQENRVFWGLTIGSFWFYITFLGMGLLVGNLETTNHRGFFQETAVMGPLYAVPLALAGLAMVTGFWYFLYVLGSRVWVRGKRASLPALFVVFGIAALVVGTLQGPIQAFAPVELWMARAEVAGDQIAQAHALLNITAGVMVILMGLALTLLPELTRLPVRRPVALLALAGVWGGTFMYYAVSLPFSILETNAAQHENNLIGIMKSYMPVEPLLLLVAGAIITIGFAAFAAEVFHATGVYRRRAVQIAESLPGIYSGEVPGRVRRRRVGIAMLIEATGCMFGFPGGGWIYTGRTLQGSLMAMAGPGMAWGILPAVTTPYGGFLRHWGVMAIFAWLVFTAVGSSLLLAFVHRFWPKTIEVTTRRRSWLEETGLAEKISASAQSDIMPSSYPPPSQGE